MPSTNKTPKLSLNQWILSDKPKMDDFNSDNLNIENYITAHTDNTGIHLSANDRTTLASVGYQTGYYDGNGQSTQTISLPFTPKFIIVYPLTTAPISYDAENNAFTYRLGMVSSGTSIACIQSTTNGLIVKNESHGEDSYLTNSTNVRYCYIAFK